MVIAVIILLTLSISMGIYIIVLKREMQNISSQLEKRLEGNSHRFVRLELISRDLNRLAEQINKSLRAEENLRLKSVKEENEFKELIANLSHDLRTPLTAIKGYLQLLNNSELDEKQKARLLIARKHTDDLGQLIEHFFEYSYLLNASLKVNPEKINISNLVTECLAGVVPLFEEKNIFVEIEESEPVIVEADKEMTKRIIQNLIRNCVTYSAGDVKVKIFNQNGYGEIHFINPVNDSSHIDTEKLFDRFYSSDKSRNRSTGLGLSIVKILAQGMSGDATATLLDGELNVTVRLRIWE